jgi:hypothetical protein
MTPLSRNARVAGLLYIVGSMFGVVRLIWIPSALIVRGNGAATASNIASHELFFRFGIVSSLVAAVLWIFVTLALYRLFKDVDHGLAVLMVILGSLMVTPLFFVNTVTDAGALLFARGADFLAVFDKLQRGAFVRLFLNLHHQLDLANEVFWGLWLLPLGLLVYKSRFLPRFLGVWLMLACFAYLASSFTGIMLPQYEDKVFSIASPINLGELVFMLWLVIMGVNERRVAAAK